MKFLCIDCDQVMEFAERQLPGDGTMAAVFKCEKCSREMAMLTNPMETQFVSSMGVKVGGREVPAQPLEGVRTALDGARDEAFAEEVGGDPGAGAPAYGPGNPAPVEWTGEAVDRLQNVPKFVRGMVKRIYTDWARENQVRTITPEVMDRARSDLGLEHM
jgi:hypothetical protein